MLKSKMVRNRKHTRKLLNEPIYEDVLKTAVLNVVEDGWSVRAAASNANLVHMTLQRYVTKYKNVSEEQRANFHFTPNYHYGGSKKHKLSEEEEISDAEETEESFSCADTGSSMGSFLSPDEDELDWEANSMEINGGDYVLIREGISKGMEIMSIGHVKDKIEDTVMNYQMHPGKSSVLVIWKRFDTVFSAFPTIGADAVFLTESWLKPEICDAELFDTNLYNVFRKDRDFGSVGRLNGGGVVTIIDSNFCSLSFSNVISANL
ncbi:hypothetical protein QE152_g10299 [Popillia japonica]|uniref:Transposase n=1 Tax=Popillia japonica TaxID=7064 RepID=A0AAW1LWY0_POPJA